MEEYLKQHNLKDIEDIAKHIEELKRNTSPNMELISSLCSYIFLGDYTTTDDVEVTMPFGSNFLTLVVDKKNLVNQREINSQVRKAINSTRHKSRSGETHTENSIFVKEGTGFDYLKEGVKESQSVDKAPVFTYCKVNKNALEALSLRALYGHKKYNVNGADEDWQNFTRVPNGNEEYGNAEFRHALGIGGDETEEEHLISAAWNAVARLEIYLRDKLNKS